MIICLIILYSYFLFFILIFFILLFFTICIFVYLNYFFFVSGRILVFVWALEQEEGSKRKFEKQDVFVSWNLPPKYIQSQKESHSISIKENIEIENNNNENNNENDKEEKKNSNQKKTKKKKTPNNVSDGMVFQRYCHVYKKGELEELFLKIPGIKVVSSWYESSNWCCIFEKN